MHEKTRTLALCIGDIFFRFKNAQDSSPHVSETSNQHQSISSDYSSMLTMFILAQKPWRLFTDGKTVKDFHGYEELRGTF